MQPITLETKCPQRQRQSSEQNQEYCERLLPMPRWPLYREVPADILATELDTCWVNVGGENPANFIRKYSGRTPVVHLKDFVMPGKKPEKMYALIGIDEQAQSKTAEQEAFGFRPIGYGVQNFEDIFAAAGESGAKWLIVEQDQPSMGKAPLECAKMSIEFVKKINK